MMLNRKCYRIAAGGLKWQYIAIIATFLVITDVSVVCCLSVLGVQTKTSKFGIHKK